MIPQPFNPAVDKSQVNIFASFIKGMLKTILIVEDYDDSRLMLKFHLENKGYRIIEAADGIEAVRAALNEAPDLVLMDIALPELDGIEAVREIKSSEDGKNTPIVCVTALGEVMRNLALDAGCEEVIGKPFKLSDLDTIIERFLK